jgi:BioD-like phosphotransacetylase family protein
MNTILIAATEESSGKTAIALALGSLATDRGQSVGYMKPKGTRLQTNTGKTLDTDPMLAREVLDIDAEMGNLEPVVYSPTFIEGAIRRRDDPAEIHGAVVESFERLAEGRDTMVIEGGGQLTTGGIVDLTDPDVAELLDARVILVVDYDDPGDVDGVLGDARVIGDRLAGVVFNRVTDAARDTLEGDVVPFLERRGVPVLGVVPRTPDLAGVTVGDLADELGAEPLTDAATDGVVERFLVGAMGADEALHSFRRAKDAAVVTGGDRPDIHTAALEAPGVTCLVLTGGFRPSPAVLGKAEERGVPMLLVGSETLPTVERLEGIVRGGRTRDQRTVERMSELLYEHANVGDLIGEPADANEE